MTNSYKHSYSTQAFNDMKSHINLCASEALISVPKELYALDTTLLFAEELYALHTIVLVPEELIMYL